MQHIETVSITEDGSWIKDDPCIRIECHRLFMHMKHLVIQINDVEYQPILVQQAISRVANIQETSYLTWNAQNLLAFQTIVYILENGPNKCVKSRSLIQRFRSRVLNLFQRIC